MEKIFVGVIEHKYGTNYYASRTQDGLEKQIADFCRDWWDSFVSLCDIEIPDEPEAIIEIYFDGENAGGWESYGYQETELI